MIEQLNSLTILAACKVSSFLGMPAWYQYLTNYMDDNCALRTLEPNEWGNVILLVALAVVDILLRIAGLLAVGFVIYGGIKYMTSNGDLSATKSAQETIIGAVIGLVIAIIAAGLVGFIGRTLA